MLYYLPALDCLLTETELEKALDKERIGNDDYITLSDESIENSNASILDGNHPGNHINGNIPYMDSYPIYRRNPTIVRSWLTSEITPESYDYRRNRLRDEIYRMEERFDYLDNQLNNLNRMLSHTIAAEGKNEVNTTVASIDSRVMEEIHNKESSISLLLRYMKDLHLAMYEEIEESLGMK